MQHREPGRFWEATVTMNSGSARPTSAESSRVEATNTGTGNPVLSGRGPTRPSARLRISRPPRGQPLDDAPLRAFEALDDEANLPNVYEGLAQQVVGFGQDGDRVEERLQDAHR